MISDGANRKLVTKEKATHCCQFMAAYSNELDGLILYRPYFREYTVKVGNNILQRIHWCPWCGNSLPPYLSDIFFKTIQKELGVDIGLSEIKNLPEEFQTDEWWKKRGL